MRVSRLVVAAAVGGLILAGCASSRTFWYVAPAGLSADYATYAWDTVDRLETGDPRLDNNPFFLERLQASVDRGLAGKGLEKLEAGVGTPDVILHYHAHTTQRIDINRIEQRYQYCDDCDPEVYDAGTLLLDIVDARSRKLMWRGWTESTFASVIDHQASLEQSIDEAVTRILRTFPGRRSTNPLP